MLNIRNALGGIDPRSTEIGLKGYISKAARSALISKTNSRHKRYETSLEGLSEKITKKDLYVYRQKTNGDLSRATIVSNASKTDAQDTLTIIIRRDQAENVLNAVDSLSEHHGKVLSLLAEGFDYKQIAEKTKIPVGTIKSRVHYARKELGYMIRA